MYNQEVYDDFEDVNDDVLAGLSLAQITRPLTPTSTASAGGKKFDKDLSTEDWVAYRKAQYYYTTYNKGPITSKELGLAYENAANPFELALKFHVQGVNYQTCKAKSFTFYVLEAFNEWIANHKDRYSVLTDDLKLTTFNLTTKDPNGHLFRIVASAYRFADSSELFLPYVRDLIIQHKYQMACQICQHTQLAREEFIYDFLMPLFFKREHASVLYDYFEACKSMTVPFIRAVDALMVEKTDDLVESMIRKYKYEKIPQENATYDYIKKNIPKMRKKLKIDVSDTPNSSSSQKSSATWFWINKLYKGEADSRIFEDNIKELVSVDDAEAQADLIMRLLELNLGIEALKWIHFFRLDIRGMPQDVRDQIQRAMRIQDRMGNRLEVAEAKNAYKLDMQRVELCFVNNAVSFSKMLSVFNQDTVDMLCFDCEWQPTYNEARSLALIQIALPGYVFVIDRLSTEIGAELWRELGAVMRRLNILKVGFGFEGDITLLMEQQEFALPQWIDKEFLDVSHLWELLDSSYKEAIAPVNLTQKRRLTDMIYAFLGKRLDKKMQMSNWSLRPLRPEQIVYAAIDAYSLVDIFHELRTRLANKGLDIMEPVSTCLNRQRARS